ncbi:B-cell receptor CD22-like, partial [Chanos chanos]|uniref:B-cell receptor CD22 n=1 Tax=Chanos chanos TaxID=29144 RepID=A0A6J2VP60_CHACN
MKKVGLEMHQKNLCPRKELCLQFGSIYGQNWGVKYPDSICVLKGSSVTMSCSYTYPNDNTVERTFWTKGDGSDAPDLSEDPGYKGRVHYLGDKQSDCTVQLIHVTQTDSRMYRFRFITDKAYKWLGQPGVTLSVTDSPKKTKAIVSPSDEIVEGSSVTLTCSSDANPPATYTWFKKNETVTIGKQKTHRINNISSEDSGEYHCKSSNQHGHQYSNAVSLNVLYSPKKTTVSVSPSGEIVEGSSVTLTCSSDANPPATYTWFKKNETVTIGKEETYRINKISSEDSGEYHCKSSNQHGHQYSNAVSLNVLYPPKKTTVSVSPSGQIVEGSSVTLTCSSDANPPATYTWFKKSVSPSGQIVEGSSVTLTCSSDANPPATYTWFKKNETVTIGKEETYRINKISSEDSGEYHCKSSNQHGHQYSNAVSLNVLYSPKKTTVSVSPSGQIVEGSSVTLTCSSDANPPATYT